HAWPPSTAVPLPPSPSFFNPPPPTALYTLSLHDALPISLRLARAGALLSLKQDFGSGTTWNCVLKSGVKRRADEPITDDMIDCGDRKSTRLNSSHVAISYAVFCLKKKKTASPPHFTIRAT